jgi:hypothetical protein
MVVGQAGAAEVHVFEGAVDVTLAPPPTGSAGAARPQQRAVRLVRDEAVRCPPAGAAPQRIASSPLAFARPATALDAAFAATAAASQPVVASRPAPASPRTRPADVLTDLGGRWRLDGTLDDIIGKVAGRLTAGAPAYAPGRDGGRALRLPGDDRQHVVFPYVSRGEVAVSVSMWVRPDAADRQSMIVFSNAQGSQQIFSNQLLIDNGHFAFYVWDGGPKIVTARTPVVPGRWYHVAGTAASDGTVRLYVNGVADGEPVDVGTLWLEGDRYLLGVSSADPVPGKPSFKAFAGLVADVRVYRRALSADEVSAHFSATGGEEYAP